MAVDRHRKAGMAIRGEINRRRGGPRLRDFRERMDIDQQDLAGELGLPRQFLGYIERGVEGLPRGFSRKYKLGLRRLRRRRRATRTGVAKGRT